MTWAQRSCSYTESVKGVVTYLYAFDVASEIRTPLVRELLSPGSVVLATRLAGETAVQAAIRDALAPFRTADGAYRVENEWRYLVSESGTGASSAA